MTETKRYLTQFKALGDRTWDDSIEFDDLERAKGHIRAVVETKPRLLAGRVYDQVDQRVIETLGDQAAPGGQFRPTVNI